MPIFEYRCEECGERFEKMLRNRGQAPGPCPTCRGENLKKMFSSFSPGSGQAAAGCDFGECPAAGACPGGGCAMR